MSIIIRLQNLPWAANALDIRQYFNGLQIPEGGVHIVGGELGDAFIAFSTDEDARQAFLRNDGKIKGIQIKLLLSSRTEMQRVIEQARTQSMAAFMLPAAAPSTTQMPAPVPAAVPALVPASVPEIRKDNGDDQPEKRRDRRRSRSKSRDRRDKSRDRRRRDRGRSKSREKREKRRGRSKDNKTRSRDRDRGSRRDKGRNSDNRDLDRDDKKPQDIWMNKQPTLNIIPPAGIVQNDVPSLLGWGFGAAAKTNVVAALAANLQARTVNGFQPPPQQERPRPLMETRYGDDWTNPNPPLLNEPYGFRNRSDFSPNLSLRNSRDGFEPPRGLFNQEDEDNNDDYRGGFGARVPQSERVELNTRKSRFEPPFKEKSFGAKKSRFEEVDGPPVNACVSLEPFEGSYGDLRRFFSGLPINYRGIKVINDEYGHKTGMCYVQFKEERIKAKALEMDGMQFNGEKVSIRHITDKEYEDAIDRYNPKMDELDPQAGGRNNKTAKKSSPENPPEIQDFTSLKVEGLPNIVKEQDILHIFSHYPLISLHMNAKPKGGTVAYVKFGNQEVAKQALKERAQHVINGKSVAVKPCSNQEFDEVTQTQAKLFSEDKIISDCLFMSNLPVKSNDRDISDFFSDIGLIPIKIHLISNNEGFTGQAYCEFESAEEASKAAAKDETLMGPSKVSVKLLPREEMERVLGNSLPHPGLGPGETLAPGTPLPPILPEVQLTEKGQPAEVEEIKEEDEPMPEEQGFQPPQFAPRPMLPFNRPGFPGPRFLNRPNFDMPRGRFDPELAFRGGHFGRGGIRGKFEPRGFRGRGGRFHAPRGGRFAPPNHRADTPPSDVAPGCTVYMDNVPFKAGTNEILDFFEGYNCTNEVSRMYNNDHTPSALAKVTFYNSEDAEKAVRELNGQKIWNRPITLTQE